MNETGRAAATFVTMYEALLLQDMVRHHGQLGFDRDFEYLRNRTKNEGYPFLAKTLPLLAKAVDTALVNGVFTCPPHFKKKRGTAYPLFLNGLLNKVFDPDGSITSEPDVCAVKDIRQCCYLLYKYEFGYAEEEERRVIDTFIKCDNELRDLPYENLGEDHYITHILEVAHTLLSDLLSDIDFDHIVPNHGPGAVASGEKNWEKMGFRYKWEPLHQQFPYYKYMVSNAMDLAANVRKYKSFEHKPKAGIAKIVLVPKDSRGPRLISMEPLEYQWIQQGVRKKLYSYIESHALTRGHVNFTDQRINQRLALTGSMSGKIQTLDMKEASDRIQWRLVTKLFRDTSLLPAIDATRTRGTELPDRTLFFNKFAPMGSALCFPIMALVHWALAVSTFNVIGGSTIKQALKSVYVYGDDIVIKSENHMLLYHTFPFFGMKFNEGKCCATGIFRESCGMDAVLGQDVSVTKVKKKLPKQTRGASYDAVAYVAYTDYCNQFWDNCYYSLSNVLRDLLDQTYGQVPEVRENADCPGLITRRWPSEIFTLSKPDKRRWRYNAHLQRTESSVLKTRSVKKNVTCDRREYHRKLVTKGLEFRAGVYTVPRSIKLIRGWSDCCHCNQPSELG